MIQAPDPRSAFGNLIERLVRIAVEEGLSADDICRRLSADALVLAAEMHVRSGGSDESFIRMARHSLALVRTGAMEQ